MTAKERYTRKTKYTRKGAMFNTTRALLQQFYQPFNIKMAALTGDAAFLYKG